MYTLELTAQDLDTIGFVGHRYGWSDALCKACLEVGHNEIPEHVAWELQEAFESDCEGGHSSFPMLDPASKLCRKLTSFWVSIV